MVKWKDNLTLIGKAIVLFGFFMVLFTHVNIDNNSFLFSVIFTILSVIGLILHELYDDYLRKSNLNEVNSNNKMSKSKIHLNKKNNKGQVDPRIIWVLIALAILYLLWKEGIFQKIFG